MISFGESKVLLNGKEIGFLDKTADRLTIDEKPEWDGGRFCEQLSVKFEMSDEATDALNKIFEESMHLHIKAIEAWVERCLRTRVSPPIKGEITYGKIRWRGLALVFEGKNLYGIMQHRRVLYSVDGNDYLFHNNKFIKI